MHYLADVSENGDQRTFINFKQKKIQNYILTGLTFSLIRNRELFFLKIYICAHL